MFWRRRKGIGALLIFNIFLIFLALSLFLFVTFFTYHIRFAKTQTMTKSLESLFVLSLVNREYDFGENFALSLSNDTKTSESITNYIIEFNKIPPLPIDMDPSIYYYYNFSRAEDAVEYVSNGKCLNEPTKCRDYTFIIKFPIPILYDGKNFIAEGTFISFV